MAQPAKGPVTAPGSTPPVHTEDAVTSVHPVDEKLHFSRLVPAALQHIAAMYAGVVTPPLIRVRSRFVVAVAGGALLVLGAFRALVAVLLDPFFHHLGTRSRQPAPALESS